MAELEKVLKGLECCADVIMCPEECPYKPNAESVRNCWLSLVHDAMELLKVHVPRVLTLDEVKQWDEQATHEKEPVYVENIYEPDYTWAHVRNFCDPYDGYGISWRCWTSRPSDEQREETPWEK